MDYEFQSNSQRMSDNTSPEKPLLELLERFRALYGEPAIVVQAPGRINLIGEHTDYNEGFVLPAAIEFQTQIAVARRGDRRLRVTSENYGETVEFDLDDMPASARGHWSDYIAGVVGQLDRILSNLPGANALINGNVPQGAGLSSSASLEVAVCQAMLEISGNKFDGARVAELCQRAENEFVGARCGIMDQFVSVHGKRNHALMLDCRTLECQQLPIPSGLRLVICNTMVRHSVAAGAYNKRRAECETGARYFAERVPGTRTLRDVTRADFERFDGELPEVIRRRCRHVLSENSRVLQAADALRSGDVDMLGRLMERSHASLRDDFEVSCEELDLMVRLARENPGVCGARMTGGGFGGCTINLVQEAHVEDFRAKVAKGYERTTGRLPEIYISSAADGAGRLA
ncbi:MAG TPA: galactokinase [Candidatus Acidoferrum sp.]|nr:galactokinase [Candidatus Acidoferrum sp.]